MLIDFLVYSFTGLGHYVIKPSSAQNVLEVYNTSNNPNILEKVIYYKYRYNQNGWWGPYDSVLSNLPNICSNYELLLVSDKKVYSLSPTDIAKITPQNFTLSSKNEFHIYESSLISIINPVSFNLP